MPKARAKTAESEANIYAIVGSDESEVKRTAAERAAELTPPDAGEFGLEIIDAQVDNSDQAVARIRSTIEALQTLPFFGGRKLVWLKNANFLGDSGSGSTASVQSALEDLADLFGVGFGSEVTFLISATEAMLAASGQMHEFEHHFRNALLRTKVPLEQFVTASPARSSAPAPGAPAPGRPTTR